MQRQQTWATLLLVVCGLLPTLLLGQAEGVDTTSESYRRRYEIGKTIGEWLPFIIIFTLALMVIIRTYRLSQKDQ
ncbi:MAG: hypothetical protein GVY26_09280 [Bacteroidetes bacterium]|jgi:TRAP-type mannitol/chloroaromatic compound transport system permease small subunit|nr:hypothetical protein [Bacteroidota bacterium]